MKKSIFLLAFFLLMGSFYSYAQEKAVTYPSRVSKAVAFAKSAPLRELAAVVSPDKDLLQTHKIANPNEVEYDKWGKEETGLDLPADKPQTKQGTRQAKGLLASFKGIGSTGFTPPDTDGDISSNHFVQVVNSKYAVYNRSGTKLLGPLSLSTLWNSLPGPWVGRNDGDPIVLFDEEYQRWVITQFAIPSNGNYELFAISETEDPTGAYYLYAFSFGTKFNDYPKLGVWSGGYAATYNLFSNHNNGYFVGSKITMVERSKMVNGEPDPVMIEFLKNNWYASMPADIDGTNMPGANEPCPVMHINRNSKKIIMMELTPDWNNPSNSTLDASNTLTPNYFTPMMNGIVQPNGQELDALGAMVMNRLAYRKFADHESMVTNHTIRSGGKAAVRWYEFRKSGSEDWSIYQQGTYAPDNEVHRWMGSAAINANGDIAIGYSVTNNTDVHPSIRATGRLANDPLGTMTVEEIVIKEGTQSQDGANRWGDYSCMNVDPTNGTDFWYTTEYNGWKTWIASFSLDGEAPAPTANAGEDDHVCKNKPYQCQGSGTSWQSVQWTTSGDGSFIGGSTMTPKYIRGNQDVANGSVILTINITGLNGDVVSDDMTLYFDPYANAGDNQWVFPNQTEITLAGETNDYSSVEWTTSGTGTFSNANAINTVYIATEADIAADSVSITLKITTDGCSGSASDKMKIYWTDGIDENHETFGFNLYPNPTNGIFTIALDQLEANETLTYIIYTTTGREVFREVVTTTSSNYQKQIDMSDFIAGMYFVTVQSAKGNKTLKFMKQ